MLNFSDLLKPISTIDFYEEYWRKKPVLISQEDEDNFDTILTLQEVNDYFSNVSLLYPYVRLVNNGTEIDFKKYHLISDGLFNIINKDTLFKYFSEGSTIVIQGAQFQFSNLRNFVASLEKELKLEINANVYITPSNSKGFLPHFDPHEVIVLQIVGTKSWNIYHDILIEAPLKGALNENQLKHYLNTEAVHKIKLQRGDILYIPRGVVHDAFCENDLSIHVTLGFNPILKIDIIHQLVKRIENIPYFREPFSTMRDDFNPDEAGIEIIDKVNKVLIETLHELPIYNGYKLKYKNTIDLFKALLLIDNLSIEDIETISIEVLSHDRNNLNDFEIRFLNFIQETKCMSKYMVEANTSFESIKDVLKSLIVKERITVNLICLTA
jgi:hypothetical protein